MRLLALIPEPSAIFYTPPMQRKATRLSVWLILSVVLAIGATMVAAEMMHASQQDSAIVRVVPPSGKVSSDSESIVVEIVAENVKDLAGFQWVLTSDRDLLRPLDAKKTFFLGSTGRELVCPEPAVEPGAIRFACVTLRAVPEGVDGSGVLATVTFKPVAVGTSALTLTHVKLVHPDGSELSSTVVNANISLSGGGWLSRGRLLALASGGIVLASGVLAAAVQLRRRKRRRLRVPAETEVTPGYVPGDPP